jgi:hypothetical protein
MRKRRLIVLGIAAAVLAGVAATPAGAAEPVKRIIVPPIIIHLPPRDQWPAPAPAPAPQALAMRLHDLPLA